MSALTDRLCIQFADDSCVQEGLTHRRGLGALGNLPYTGADIERRQVALAGVPRSVVALPACAPMRTPGTDETSRPATKRVRGERGLPR